MECEILQKMRLQFRPESHQFQESFSPLLSAGLQRASTYTNLIQKQLRKIEMYKTQQKSTPFEPNSVPELKATLVSAQIAANR